MARLYIKPASTNVVEIPDVYNELTGKYITSADSATTEAATATLGAVLSSTKAALSPSVVLTWTWVAGAIPGVATIGVWRATVPDSATAIVDATAYYARMKLTVTATSVVRYFYVALIARADDN